MAAYFPERMVKNVPNPTPSFSNILLISKLIKVLQLIEKKQSLNQSERDILSRAKKLISKIIEGARVIEDKGFENAIFPIEEVINVYGYALRAMESLNLYEEAQESTLFFEGLFDKLERIENDGESDNELVLLKKFFLALGDSFSSEIYRRENQSPKTVETPAICKI